MTVEDVNKIDFVAHRDDLPLVLLVVADHLDWSDEPKHMLTLQAKLNAYLAFLEMGQFARDFPSFRDRPIRIEIRFLHGPPAHVQEHFLSRAAQAVRGAGFDFGWRTGQHSADMPPK